jgi:hypothetical protein
MCEQHWLEANQCLTARVITMRTDFYLCDGARKHSTPQRRQPSALSRSSRASHHCSCKCMRTDFFSVREITGALIAANGQEEALGLVGQIAVADIELWVNLPQRVQDQTPGRAGDRCQLQAHAEEEALGRYGQAHAITAVTRPTMMMAAAMAHKPSALMLIPHN